MDKQVALPVLEGEKSLGELLEPLRRVQRDYILFRLLGVGESEAMRIVNRRAGLGQLWKEENPEFALLERQIILHKEGYRQQALVLVISEMTAKAQLVLWDLIEKGLDWEKLEQGDKPYVMRAIDFLKNMHLTEGERGHSYDELLIRLRKKGRE